MKLAEAIKDPNSQVQGSVMVVDMVGSSELKANTPESAWLGLYAQAFNVIEMCLPGEAELVKFLGDGVVVVFPDDQAAPAINCAIRIQESMDALRRDEQFSCQFCIAIATGRFRKIAVDEIRHDYLGAVVDKAFRLCGAANAKAIFVDSATVAAANVNKIKSIARQHLGYEESQYVSPPSSIPLKGFKLVQPVHEIMWARDSFGLKPDYASSLKTVTTNSTENRQALTSPYTPRLIESQNIRSGENSNKRPFSIRGRFDKWIPSGAGFIAGDNERFITKLDQVIDNDELKNGDIVFFVPVDDSGKSRRATGVVRVGKELSGVIVSKKPGDKYAFIQSEQLRPYFHSNIYAPLGAVSEQFFQGNKVVFELGESWDSKKQIYTMQARDIELED